MGALLAALEPESITLMTVVREGDSEAQAEKRLEVAQEILQAPATRVKIREGEAATEILEESLEHDYDLVVVGAHMPAHLLSLLLNPVTRKVVSKAEACVLVVSGDRPSLERILICTAGKIDDAVVRTGARVARLAKAQVTLLHVTAPVPAMYTGLEAMEETLAELLQTDTPLAEHLRAAARYLADEGVEAELQLRHGAAYDEIVREARKGDYDLIVVGPGPLSGSLRRLVMDDVTMQVIDRAPCPVLVVRGGCE